MEGYKGILGIQRDTAGYSGIQRDTAGYSGIQWDTVGYSGIQRDTAEYSGVQRDAPGYSGIQRDIIKYTLEHGYFNVQMQVNAFFSGGDRGQQITTTYQTRMDNMKSGRHSSPQTQTPVTIKQQGSKPPRAVASCRRAAKR